MLLLWGLMIGLSFSSMATHFAGGEITYEHVSGNTFTVTLKIFRDCDGANFGSVQSIRLSPTTSGFSMTVSEISRTDITVLCPGQVPPCSSGSVRGGIQQIVYKATKTFVPLPAGQEYSLAFTTCCRNGDITTGSANGWFYISSTLDPSSSLQNTSPVFLNPPYSLLLLCTSQQVSISPNAFDADGDALQFSLVSCKARNATESVPYASGLSGTNPLFTTSGVSVDPFTGLISFVPDRAQVGVLCILVEEFRNGIKIGEIVRDIQVNIQPCSNTPPVVASIGNQIIAPGATLCLNVSATDADNNNIGLSAFSGLFPANATFTQTSATPGAATGQICITPTAAQVGQTFSVSIEARDDDCPVPGIGSISFNVTVPATTCATSLAEVITNAADCNASDGAIDITPTGFFNPIQYTWTGPNGFTVNTQDISGVPAGDYTVNVVGGASCVETKTYTVGLNTPLPTPGLIESLMLTVGGADKTTVFTSLPTGIAPFTYNFDLTGADLGPLFVGAINVPVAGSINVTGVDPTNPATNPVATLANLDPTFVSAGIDGFTYYDITVTDANGCVAATMPQVRVDVVFPSATGLTLNAVTLTACEYVAGSGVGDFDLISAQNLINGDVDNDGADGSVYTVSYHPSQTDAQNGTNPLADGNNLNPTTDEVWVKVVSGSGAEGVIELGLMVQEDFDRLCIANNWGDDVPTSYISNIVDYNHAIYLYDFPDGSGGFLDSRFLWETTGSFKFFNDGTAVLTGTVVNTQDANVKFDVNFLIGNRYDWTTWSGLGRTYKDDSPHNTVATTEHVNWSYFEIDPTSTLTGSTGSTYDGDVISMSHMPANLSMGGQLGNGANDKDDTYGFSAWYFWSATLGGATYTNQHGDVNVDLDCSIAPCSQFPTFDVMVAPVAVLEGAYDAVDDLMRDDLRTTYYVPATEPYTALGYVGVGGGGENVSALTLSRTGNDAIVDWVWLELRDEFDPTLVISSRAALMQRDGDIVDIDGTSAVSFGEVGEGKYYFVIKHRNHLGIMTESPISLSSAPATVNFEDGSMPTYGTNAQNAIGTTGRFCMVCANVTGDGAIDAADRSEVWNQRSTVGYSQSDANCDGATDAADRSATWNNRSRSQQIPD
ncbi:MAG: hypothetical protein AB8H47_17145 [Bacteroidia bacterium]